MGSSKYGSQLIKMRQVSYCGVTDPKWDVSFTHYLP